MRVCLWWFSPSLRHKCLEKSGTDDKLKSSLCEEIFKSYVTSLVLLVWSPHDQWWNSTDHFSSVWKWWNLYQLGKEVAKGTFSGPWRMRLSSLHTYSDDIATTYYPSMSQSDLFVALVWQVTIIILVTKVSLIYKHKNSRQWSQQTE